MPKAWRRDRGVKGWNLQGARIVPKAGQWLDTEGEVQWGFELAMGEQRVKARQVWTRLVSQDSRVLLEGPVNPEWQEVQPRGASLHALQ